MAISAQPSIEFIEFIRNSWNSLKSRLGGVPGGVPPNPGNPGFPGKLGWKFRDFFPEILGNPDSGNDRIPTTDDRTLFLRAWLGVY